MIAVIFEAVSKPDRREEYFHLAAALRAALEDIEGFISVERFQSFSDPDKLLSLSIWRDEDALARWRTSPAHRSAQKAGRSGILEDYQLRIATIVRDYGMTDRAEAPDDSNRFHSPGR